MYVQFLPTNVVSMASQRVEEGHLTVNFEGVNWNMVVISDAKDKASLQNLYALLERMRAGESVSGKNEAVLDQAAKIAPQISTN